MKLSDNEISILLLNSSVALDKSGVSPLTQSEWAGLLNKLIEYKFEPKNLLQEDSGKYLDAMGYGDEFKSRVTTLMGRSVKLSMGLEKLSHDGINIITIVNSNYPVLLRKKLKDKVPPVLYYVGDINYANKIGIGIVGSRRVSSAGLEFTRRLALQATREKLVVYSGGAKGVDITAEYTSINNGGVAVEFIAESMYEKIKSSDAIKAVLNNKLLLISDMNPEEGFKTWRAINRNKYIYASSYGAFVIEADYNSGGTWAGAKEAIEKKYTRVFVRESKEHDGNTELIKLGGRGYKTVEDDLKSLILGGDPSGVSQLSIFDN